MYLHYLLLFLFLPTISVLAQKSVVRDTIRFESKKVAFHIPKIVEEEKEALVSKDSLQKELNDYLEIMRDQKFISRNVIVNVETDFIEKDQLKDIKVTYSYSLKNDTLTYETDDFTIGSYKLDESNAMVVTLEVMKRSIENQLAAYIHDGTEITFTIDGSADATAINGKIPYRNEYGELSDYTCLVNNRPITLSISSKIGIRSNVELAFLRSYTVRYFLSNELPIIDKAQNVFVHVAKVSEFKGGEFRRVSIEMVIHNAINKRLTSDE